MSTPTNWSTIAARVPDDLRDDVRGLVGTNGYEDLSQVVRKALRELVHRERTGAPLAGGLFDPGQGAARRHDRATSKAAALDVAPRVGSQRRRALEVITLARRAGATTDEVILELERQARASGTRPPAVNGVARRVTDLLEAGAIEELRRPPKEDERLREVWTETATGRDPDEPVTVTRKTRHGSQATVWVSTAKGRAWLAATGWTDA